MNVVEAVQAGIAVVIEHPSGGDRIMAAAIQAPGGLVFADSGWSVDDSGRPLHYVKGALTEAGPEGPWKVGDITCRLLDHGDVRAGDWNSYQAWLKSSKGARETPENFIAEARRYLVYLGLFAAP